MSSWSAPVERLLSELILGNLYIMYIDLYISVLGSVLFCFFTTFLFFSPRCESHSAFTVCYRKVFYLVISAVMGLHFVDYKCRGTG